MSTEEKAMIPFWVTVELKKRVETRAEHLGLNTSNYIRYLIMKDLDPERKNNEA